MLEVQPVYSDLVLDQNHLSSICNERRPKSLEPVASAEKLEGNPKFAAVSSGMEIEFFDLKWYLDIIFTVQFVVVRQCSEQFWSMFSDPCIELPLFFVRVVGFDWQPWPAVVETGRDVEFFNIPERS